MVPMSLVSIKDHLVVKVRGKYYVCDSPLALLATVIHDNILCTSIPIPLSELRHLQQQSWLNDFSPFVYNMYI